MTTAAAKANAYAGYSAALNQPQSTGSPGPRPKHIRTASANRCTWCNSVWISSPYDPAEDPPEHRLMCVDGWTPEYLVWTVTYWKGYIEPSETTGDT